MKTTGWKVFGLEANTRIAEFRTENPHEDLVSYGEAKASALQRLREHVAPYLTRIEELEQDVFGLQRKVFTVSILAGMSVREIGGIISATKKPSGSKSRTTRDRGPASSTSHWPEKRLNRLGNSISYPIARWASISFSVRWSEPQRQPGSVLRERPTRSRPKWEERHSIPASSGFTCECESMTVLAGRASIRP